MQVYLYVEINIFALIVLFLIYVNTHHKGEKYLMEQKLYKYLLLINMLILITDTFMWALDGTKNIILGYFLIFSTLAYYFINPIVCMIWSIYVDFQINRNEDRMKKLLFPMLIPVIVNAVLSILSLFGNYLFYFDDHFVYHRGKLFFLIAFFTYTYLLYTFLYVVKERKRILKPYFKPILLFAILPSIGGIFQFLFYGVTLIWIAMTISMLIIFIDIQNEQMYLDYLTGLYNRRQLDFHLQELFHKNKKGSIIAGILIDVDSFKNINDHYGHTSGDEALKYTAQILNKSFDNNAFISRFGGDEFVILFEIKDKSELTQTINQLKENVKAFNLKKITTYDINLSIGSACYEANSKMTQQEFLNNIDFLMYQDKQLVNV